MSSLIRGAITHPIAVLAIVLAMILFGLASLQTIPIQMTPDIDKPVLQVRVSWPGASPKDVEREIVLRLKLYSMRKRALLGHSLTTYVDLHKH